ncbi:hypothetical protein ACQWU4_11505 [Chryseobacterium sp. MIQD13]|uniref:hypothetical protein n=1 Tax=Chryseobacterium sp. MIQD13 TaxID=3422310 RepID=UPI003D2E005D
MFNFIKKLFLKETLTGEWLTEDGSGFSMIMGSWIEFKRDGTGSYESWYNGEESYHLKGSFNWVKTGPFQIKIQESNKDPEIIDYRFQTIHNRTELLNSSGKVDGKTEFEQFWNLGQTVFKK